MVCSTRPCILLSSKGEFLERDLQQCRVDHPGLVEIDQDRGRPARLSRRRPDGRPSSLAGLMVMARSSGSSADLAVMVEAQRRGEQRLEADGAVGGFGEGMALHVGVLRIVAGDDHVDVAGGRARAPWRRGRPRARSGGFRRKNVR